MIPERVVATPQVDIRPEAMLHARRMASDTRKPTVLVVDDDRSTLGYLEHILSQQDYRVLVAADGEQALKILNASHSSVSVVVMDLYMPGLNGLDVVQSMKASKTLCYVPVIMTTASVEPDVIRKGIEAGAYYCLHKPIDSALLGSLVEVAIHEFDHSRMRQEAIDGQRHALGMMETARFTCRNLSEVEVLSVFLAAAYPDPKRTLIGISELLINAVEHGNLGITYDEKTQLVTAGTWRETVDERQQQPLYNVKKVDVVLQRNADGIYLQISDEGEGFEWWRYLEIDPARATHPNGRGIALANKISFDRLQFSQNGSRVLAVVEATGSDGGKPGKKATTLQW
jgi:two-component system, cell cycle response regulator